MLKLKLQYFGHLMRRTDVKTLMLGKTEGKRIRGRQRMRWLDESLIWWTWTWAGSGSWWWTRKPGVLQSMASQTVGHSWATEQQHRWENWGLEKLRFCQWMNIYVSYKKAEKSDVSYSQFLPEKRDYIIEFYIHLDFGHFYWRTLHKNGTVRLETPLRPFIVH